MKLPSALRTVRVVPLLAGSATALIGLAAIGLWLLPAFHIAGAPAREAVLRFNTALGLAVCGSGLALAACRWQRTAAAMAAGAVVIGLLALVRDLASEDPGIHPFLVESPVISGLLSFDPMPPPTAFAVISAGLSILAGIRWPVLGWTLGAGTLALGAIPVVGYLTGTERAFMYGPALGETSPGAATGLVVLSVGLIALRPSETTTPRPSISWRPLIGAGVALLATVLLWRTLEVHQDTQLRRTVETGARGLESEIRARMQSLSSAVEQVAASWAGDEASANARWRETAAMTLTRRNRPRVIELIGSDFRLRERLEQPDASWQAEPAATSKLPRVTHSPLDAARAHHEAVWILAGGQANRPPALRVAAPVFSAGHFDGFIAGVFDFQPIVDSILAAAAGRYTVNVSIEGEPMVVVADPAQGHGWIDVRWIHLPGGLRLKLEVGPSTRLLHSTRRAVPDLVLAFGLVACVLLLLALREADKARGRTRELEALNRSLDVEIAERRSAEERAVSLAREMENRVQARTVELTRANTALRHENAARRHWQEELRRSNEDLERFASSISHELRQPLGSAHVWADLLDAESARAGDRPRKYIARLRAALDRTNDIVASLRRLASIHGARQGAVTTVDLARVMRLVLDRFQQDLAAAGARVEVGSLPVIEADAIQLTQLFTNLIQNAIKYRRPDTPLHVRIDAGTAESTEAHTAFEIRVRDNGRGFDAVQGERIFEPFRRVGEMAGDGAGLGLTICKRIVEQHGGSIRAEGRLGIGATFAIILPVRTHHGTPA